MRLRWVLLVALFGGTLIAGEGAAAPGDGRFRRAGGFHGGAHAEMRASRQAERAQQKAMRAAPARELPVQRAPEPPVAPIEAPAVDRGAARPGRLTPDERRALRQQINEAGRDVYRPTRP